MQLKFKNSAGLSLVELLISMAISLIIIGAAVSLLTVNAYFAGQQLKQDTLQAKLFTIAIAISNEINRAGFCFTCLNSNPYRLKDKNTNISSILIDDSASKLEGSCIRFAYNHDKRENPIEIDKNDAKGFRLGKGPDGKSTIEIYENYNGLTNWHCDSKTGYSGYWQDMTTDNLVLEQLSFSRQTLALGKDLWLQIRVKLVASLKGSSEIKEALTFDIKVRNIDG